MPQPIGLLAERYELITEVPDGLAPACYFAIDTSIGRIVVVRLVGSDSASWVVAARGAKQRHLASIIDVIDAPPSEAFPGLPTTSRQRAIVAEVFRGTSLRALIRRERLSVDRSVAWTLRIAEALRALHAQGAAHGAISPYSILAQAHGRAISPVVSQLLVPPMALFASPERLCGEGPSPSDDLWALGVLMYCLLTGSVPFQGDTPAELLKSIQETSRANLTLKAGSHMRELESAVRRWLAPARHRRPPNIDDVVDTLDRWECRSPTAVQPLAPALNERRSQTLTACLAEGDEVVFDDSCIPDSYDLALAAVQEERNLPRTVHPYEDQEVHSDRTPISSVTRPPPAVAPVTLSMAPEARVLVSERVSRVTLEPESFGSSALRRPRWGLFTLLVVLGAGVGAAVVSLFGGPSNVARTVAKVVQQHSLSGLSTSATDPTQEHLSPKQELDHCVRGYFPTDAFAVDADLEFVCKNENLLEVAQKISVLAAAIAPNVQDAGATISRNTVSAAPATPPSASVSLVVKSNRAVGRTWQLGWYELVAVGMIQRSCCHDPPAIKLPITTGWCQQLQTVVTNIANQSTKPGEISPAIRAFDESITCLASQGKHMVYPYRSVPTTAQKAAFQQFLKLAAEMDARRASKKF